MGLLVDHNRRVQTYRLDTGKGTARRSRCGGIIGLAALILMVFNDSQAWAQRVKVVSTQVSVAKLSCDVGETVALHARLTSARGEALIGRKLIFQISPPANGGAYATIGSAMTDAEGDALVSYTVPETLLHGKKQNTARIKAIFDGDTLPQGGIRYKGWWGWAPLNVSRTAGDGSGTPPTTPATPESTAGNSTAALSDQTDQTTSKSHSSKPTGKKGGTTETVASASEGEGEAAAKNAVSAPNPLNRVLSEELKACLTSEASTVRAGVLALESGVTADAVGLNVNGFEAATPRFWLEAHLVKLATNPKKVMGVEVPGTMEVEAEIRFLLSDTFTGDHQEWSAKKKKPGFGVKLPVTLGEKKTSQINRNTEGGNIPAGEEGVVFRKFLGTDDGKVLLEVLHQGVTKAKKIASDAEWMVRVLSVSGSKITLSGGKGAGVVVGQQLGIKKLQEVIKEGPTVMDIEYEPRGVVVVTELREKTIIARIVSGSSLEKGLLATKVLSSPPAP